MPPPTHFEVAISAVERLVKEEQSYHREIQQQTDKIKQLEHEKSEDENREYLLKQERLALEETKKVLPNLRQKIDEAVEKLEKVLVEEGKRGHESNVKHITAAKEAIAKAKTAKREIA